MKFCNKSGQTMVEYILAVLALLFIVTAMGYVIVAAKNNVSRTEALVSSDYP